MPKRKPVTRSCQRYRLGFFMETNGWVKIHRKLLDWEWFDDSETFKLFIYILLSVNHEDRKWRGIVIKAGQMVTSYSKLSIRLGVSVRSIRTRLNYLKSTGEVTSQNTNRYTVLTVNRYIDYQTNDKPADSQATSKRQANDNKQELKELKNTVLNTVHKSKDLRVDAIIEMFKTKFNKTPVDRKPRFIAYTFSKAIRTFISKVEDVRPDLTYDVMVEKAFGYYISKYPDIQPEYIDTVYRYAKQLLAAQLLKIKPQTL